MHTYLNHHIPQVLPIYDSFKSMLIINYPREGAYVPTDIDTMVYTYMYICKSTKAPHDFNQPTYEDNLGMQSESRYQEETIKLSQLKMFIISSIII